MDKSQITTDKRVYIPAGCGYTDYTSGITRFCRAVNNIRCEVISENKGVVYLFSDDNHKLYTDNYIIQELTNETL